MGVVLPLAAAVGLGMLALAIHRFEAFVLLMLVLRSGLDISKLSGHAAGNTVTETSSTRALDPASILSVLFLLSAAFWLAAQYRQRGELKGSTLRRTMLVFGLTCLASLIDSQNRKASAVDTLRIFSVIVMFVVLEQLMRDRAKLKRLLSGVYLSLAFPLLFTLAGFATGHPHTDLKGGYTRITGPFNSSNDFGRYLMLMIVFGVALLPYVERRYKRVLGGALALSAVFLMLTYTRTALIGTVIGLIVVGIINDKRVLKGLVVAGLCGLLLVPQLSARFSSVTKGATSTGAPSGNSLVWRLNYWTEILPLANANPVTGIGINMTQFNTSVAKQPHNDYIRAYVETGLVGLIAYIVMLVTFVRTGRRAVRASPPKTFDRAVAVGFLGCAVAYVTVSLAANVMSNVVTLWYLAAFAAAACSVLARHEAAARMQPVRVVAPSR